MKEHYESLIQIRGSGVYACEYPYYCNGKVHRYHGDFKIFERCDKTCLNYQRKLELQEAHDGKS